MFDRFIPKSKSKFIIEQHEHTNYNDLLYYIHDEKQQYGSRQHKKVNSFAEQLQQTYNMPLNNANKRQISNIPEKILDAPDIVDDFYLNILDWGQNNVLGIGLKRKVYLWNAQNQSINQLLESRANVSAVHWVNTTTIAVGFENSTMSIIDVPTGKSLVDLYYHTDRVSTIHSMSDMISSSGRDNTIINHDLRQLNQQLVSKFRGHTQEVCGLKWNEQGTTLASGANDNHLLLWDRRTLSMRSSLEGHTAAVKALNWCPWQNNILASGGGSNDRTIKLWNADEGQCLKSMDTGSQVCALQFLPRYRELISSHGFSKFQISIWNMETLHQPKLLQELQSHKSRVLHLGLSPDQSMLCSAAGDETLVFWRLGTHQCTGENKDLCSSKNLFIR